MEQDELQILTQQIQAINIKFKTLRGYLDLEAKSKRIAELEGLQQDPNTWSDRALNEKIGKEKRGLENIVNQAEELTHQIKDNQELFDLAKEEGDKETLKTIQTDTEKISKLVDDVEFKRMFSNPMDPNNCFIDFQSGSGGTEAQDWANMLLRMYVRYAEQKSFKVEVLELSDGEVAGIKGASIKISGDFAYGYFRTESGIHRLVRKSPFDSGSRRHTSFAGVNVYPEIDDSIDIEINPADLRIDTYRASGAGGQHINKTDSAVRITHVPSNTVVQCQNDRSQHRNKAEAMNMLKAQLYAIELNKRNEEKQAVEDAKSDIGWGHQIRSYVLDQSRIKDLRTGIEVGNTQGVLDGDLDPFISESLKQGV
ncbi:MAG: peptide chain release factor 2 [Nitrosomonadales bacterium]|nr:peptide chain release factor 2 [Nitrosomonadales bacterium]MBT3917878.1 peptide chain release factor 2 [Nitrosomonadales bacterium]MBT4571240.1 peptide chain release factor 2 [Nitrosomonadales bacterium]MBT5150462.1 peptide chain release factor 2 [Nitrosomonadales bacterium]MBT6014631.1 peptide chain release factor 2 [Nitrosomonadales bacterium]